MLKGRQRAAKFKEVIAISGYTEAEDVDKREAFDWKVYGMAICRIASCHKQKEEEEEEEDWKVLR